MGMGKNILIFADGTGNEGGLLPDESRTNVYKLFGATRVDPDSWIKPSEQLAFYVPGIGTPSPAEHNSATRRVARQFSNWLEPDSPKRSQIATSRSSARGSQETASISSDSVVVLIPFGAWRTFSNS
jgi:hypothetical protein